VTTPPTVTETTLLPQLGGRAWGWNREPITWEAGDGSVTWRCPGGTDFWRKTEGVPSAHSGCSLVTRVEADFELELLVRGEFVDRYDQAGLMVVASDERWLKAGIEVDGKRWLSAVHTRDESDWSRERWDAFEARLRAVRKDATIEVSVAGDRGWRVFRTLYLPGAVGIGPYSCAPKGAGFEASAAELRIEG
jgi:regulation of enolase protein 1 (concanavalin A-like superfamily)